MSERITRGVIIEEEFHFLYADFRGECSHFQLVRIVKDVMFPFCAVFFETGFDQCIYCATILFFYLTVFIAYFPFREGYLNILEISIAFLTLLILLVSGFSFSATETVNIKIEGD